MIAQSVFRSLPRANGSVRQFSSSSLRSNQTGFFVRPNVQSKTVGPAPKLVAEPHPPSHIISQQSPNFPTTWSQNQASRLEAMKGPRFEQMDMSLQPQPLAAIEMISREPIRMSTKRVVACDGGGGPLGHPKVFINLDKEGPKACPYCGIRYELDRNHH
ncbi:hypothetical protein IE53DRAFT_370523 [Violaceomyces palustris]|uniref:Uncharacterized protein n=1 Tax=Violaceomyces palustris TaxID=1673888 RepID=A0ACD0NRR4_9BASI|nr:hypothetical protein IE53DRAFT_370523 [Violaceomyces palustris]